jgi:hypothetical protein
MSMSALVIRGTTYRLRQRTAGVLVVLAVGAVIAVHHSEIASGDMEHAGMGTAIELCLGVFTAVGVAVAAIAFGPRSLGRWDTSARLLPLGVRLVARWLTLQPRAGPPGQPLLCIWRR